MSNPVSSLKRSVPLLDRVSRGIFFWVMVAVFVAATVDSRALQPEINRFRYPYSRPPPRSSSSSNDRRHFTLMEKLRTRIFSEKRFEQRPLGFPTIRHYGAVDNLIKLICISKSRELVCCKDPIHRKYREGINKSRSVYIPFLEKDTGTTLHCLVSRVKNKLQIINSLLQKDSPTVIDTSCSEGNRIKKLNISVLFLCAVKPYMLPDHSQVTLTAPFQFTSGKFRNHIKWKTAANSGIISDNDLPSEFQRQTSPPPGSRSKRDAKSISVVSGKKVVIKCPVSVSNGKDVKWEKDEIKLPVNHRQRIQTDNTLLIENAQQKVDDGPYVCIVTDGKGRQKSYTVMLRVIAAPTISLSESQPDIQEGMRMKTLCSVLHGDPPFHFTWLKDGSPVSTDLGLSIQYYKDWSMLSSDNVQLKHAGNYTCIVSNEAAATSQSSLLRVNAPPKWIIEPQNAAVVRDQSARVDCSAKGSPIPSVTWKRATGAEPGDFSPVYNSHKHTLHVNGSLVIQKAEKSEAGYYLCQANNGFGAGLSKLIYVTVYEPPSFEIKFKAHAVKKAQAAHLFCQAIGDLPLSITWIKNSNVLKNEPKYKIETAQTESNKSIHSTLTLTATDSTDSGVYSCKASNSYGEDETRIQLLVQEVPGVPMNVTILNSTGRTLSLGWMEPYRGNSVITRYVVQYMESNSVDTNAEKMNLTVLSTMLTAVIVNLKPATTYNVRLKAENSVGWGPSTEWITATTEEEAPGDPPRNVTARATGPNSIKVSWIPPKKEVWHGEIKGYYVGYKPVHKEEPFLFKTVETDDRPMELHEVHLTNMRRSTMYVVTMQAFNSKGSGPRSEEITVKTLDDVPPSAPILELVSATSSSITLGWSQKATFGNPIREYILHHRKENEPWSQSPISTQRPLYTMKDLSCGTRYYFYMTAYNSVGKSEPSETLNARTDGAAPVSPAREDFITVGASKTTLNLIKWRNNGCEITHFIIKLRQKFRGSWQTLSNNIPANQTHYIIHTLLPATLYEVQVTASSSGGATEEPYEFKTWNITEEITIRATQESHRPKSSPLVTDLEILVPVVVSGVVVLVVIIVGCVLWSKEARCNTRNDVMRGNDNKHVVDMAMKELASPHIDCMSSEDGTQRSSSSTSHFPSGQLYGPTRAEEEEEAHPYATPYDTLPVTVMGETQQGGTSGMRTLTQRCKERRINNVYSRSQKHSRDRPYEALMLSAAQIHALSPYMERQEDG